MGDIVLIYCQLLLDAFVVIVIVEDDDDNQTR